MRVTKIIIYIIIFTIFSIQNIFSQEKLKDERKKENKITKSNKNSSYLEIFNKVYNSLNDSYVDSIDQSKIILSSIDGMLDALDPYTKILRGASKERYEMLARGKYGGVGMSIDQVRDTIIITRVYEDSPSYFEGLMAGDMILSIDTTNVVDLKKSNVIKLLKGEVDTPVTLTILRRPGKLKKEFTLRRGNIVINDIPYWGLDENNVGYIKINKFSKFTSGHFKEAVEGMDSFGIKGLIIDLRSNGGGLLIQSTNILDYLLDRDLENPMLVRKGRSSVRNYYSKDNPIISTSIPIIIMQNKRSASASEIVSGVLQDLDRAVILGENSFGKGLVQITKPINDSLKLKVTTAKYYLPSGRLIQKFDYLGDGSLTDGLNKKDSIFYSSNGREIRGGGGITPDIVTSKNDMPNFVKSLWLNERLFVLFGAEYAENITNNAFLLYKIYLEDRYGEDYVDLGHPFAVHILTKNLDTSYLGKILKDKQKKMELTLNIRFTNQANKIYQQLNKHDIFKNFSNKNYDEIIEYCIDVKKYLHTSTSKDRSSVLLKKYLTDNNLFFNMGNKNNKKIGKYELFTILSRLLGVIVDLDISKLDDYDKYLYDINYSDIEKHKDDIWGRLDALENKINIQNQVIDWYIKLYYNKVTSPHKNIGFQEIDKSFISRNFKLEKEKRKLIKEFKVFSDSYNFEYTVDGEKEFNRLKEKLIKLPEFSNIDSINTHGVFEEYFKNKKYNKLIKELENYISKNKKRYFFIEENMDWIINGIFREYSKLSVDNRASVRTSLYLDSEYHSAISHMINNDEFAKILISTKK